MDISVIVPIYNMARFIPDGINSLKQQSGVDMEVILVDDGSKDDSAAVCEKCIEGDARFRLIKTENQGAGPARNTGIKSAKGEYLYFFDIDDKLAKDAFNIMVSSARLASCDLLVFGYSMSSDDSKTPIVREYADTLVDGDDARKHYDLYMTEGKTCIQGAPWNKLFRRDMTVENNVEYPDLRRNQDEVFVMRYMCFAKTIRIIPAVLYHYFSNTQERMWLKYRLDYSDNVEKLVDFYDQIILSWNRDNDGVKRTIYDLYYFCTLDAIRVVYNPKWKLSYFEIYKRVKAQVKRWREGSQRFITPLGDKRVLKSKLYPSMLNGRYLLVFLNFTLKTRLKRSAN